MEAKTFKNMVINHEVRQHFAYGLDDRTFYKFYRAVNDSTRYKMTFTLTDYEYRVDVNTLTADEWQGYWDSYMSELDKLQAQPEFTKAMIDFCVLKAYGARMTADRDSRKFYRYYADILKFMLHDHRSAL